MNSFAIFLRGINVSGQKLIKMKELQSALEKAGFDEVTTYVQSGNLAIKTDLSKTEAAQKVQDVIDKDFGFDVPCLSKSLEDLNSILDNDPYISTGKDPKLVGFVLLFDTPEDEKVKAIPRENYLPEEFHIQGDVLYFYAANGAGKAKMSNNFFESKLKVRATSRNLNTMRKMVELLSQ